MIRAPKDFGAALFLLAFGAFTFWQSSNLAIGTLRQIGPGMMPQALSFATMACGVALLIAALRANGEKLETYAIRGPLFILGAAVVFGFTVRPLGVAVAAPLTLLISAMASDETRWREAVIFCVVMTAFCLLLFKVLLGLPIPLAPWLIGY